MSPDTRIFTPYLMDGERYDGEIMSDGRAVMQITMADHRLYAETQGEDYRRSPAWVEVTDQNTQTRWLVRPAACAADCFCAAEAKGAPGTPYNVSDVCIDCKSTNVSEPDEADGMVDCLNCGAAWVPGVALRPLYGPTYKPPPNDPAGPGSALAPPQAGPGSGLR